MTTTIIYIRPEDLSPEILFTHIYPNLDQDFYWSDCWTVEFYTALARAGFITIADKDHSVLIAEMHARVPCVPSPLLPVCPALQRRICYLIATGTELRVTTGRL